MKGAIPVVAGVGPVVAGVGPVVAGVGPVVAGVGPVVAGVGPVVAGVGPVVAGVGPVVAGVGPVVAGVGPVVAGVGPVVAGVGPVVAGVGPVVAGVGPVVAGVGPVVAGVGPVVAGVGPVVAGVGPVVAGVGPVVAGVGPVNDITGLMLLHSYIKYKIKAIYLNNPWLFGGNCKFGVIAKHLKPSNKQKRCEVSNASEYNVSFACVFIIWQFIYSVILSKTRYQSIMTLQFFFWNDIYKLAVFSLSYGEEQYLRICAFICQCRQHRSPQIMQTVRNLSHFGVVRWRILPQGSHLLTWINFNPSIDKWLHPV